MTGPIVVRLTGAAVARGLSGDPETWGEITIAQWIFAGIHHYHGIGYTQKRRSL